MKRFHPLLRSIPDFVPAHDVTQPLPIFVVQRSVFTTPPLRSLVEGDCLDVMSHDVTVEMPVLK